MLITITFSKKSDVIRRKKCSLEKPRVSEIFRTADYTIERFLPPITILFSLCEEERIENGNLI